jgi:HAD superfamily hydrolase (TIGR01509 family)
MIKVISFDFYGVMYSNLDWGVINDRIYGDNHKRMEFRSLVDSANQGLIDNDQFRMRVASLAEDNEHSDSPAVHVSPIVNTALMDFMQQLKGDHDIKLAILSNGTRDHVCEVLEKKDVLKYFDEVATSAEVPNYKPDPQAFLHLAKIFKIEPSELLHVDDSPRHVEGAKEAGVNAILYSDLDSLKHELNDYLKS